MTNEEKKVFLQSYQDSLRRLKRISAEIDEIQTMETGMPWAHRTAPKRDLSGWLAELGSLKKKLQKGQKDASQTLEDVPKAINSLEDVRERSALFYRYINGLNWWEVAGKMNYAESYVHRIHARALAHLEVPQNGRP